MHDEERLVDLLEMSDKKEKYFALQDIWGGHYFSLPSKFILRLAQNFNVTRAFGIGGLISIPPPQTCTTGEMMPGSGMVMLIDDANYRDQNE